MFTDAKLFPRDCITCDAPGCDKTAPANRCSRCCSTYYCSVECQKRHWANGHKGGCISVVSIRKQREANNLQIQSPTFRIQPLNTECSICFQSPLEPATTTVLPDCRHGFCTSCIVSWQRGAKKGPIESEPPCVCPYCRTPSTEKGDVEENLLRQLSGLSRHSSSRTPEANQGILTRLEPLLEKPTAVQHLDAFVLKAELLIGLGRGTEAVQVLDDMLAEDERRRDLPIFCLLDQRNLVRDRGDRVATEHMERFLAAAYEKMDGPLPTLFPHEDMIEIIMLKCEAYAAENQWSKAMEMHNKVSSAISAITCPALAQRLFGGLARCLYHQKGYDRAISSAEMAIVFNRNAPDVHKYKALSHRAMGDLDAAIETMNRAVLYEAPWDDEHMSEVQTLYYALLVERDALQQECKGK